MTYGLIILLLGVLIIVHELGHFLAARWGGMPVARFSIGFGPRLWSRKYRETEFVLRLFPIGGYVLPAIEDEAEFIAIPLQSGWSISSVVRRRILCLRFRCLLCSIIGLTAERRISSSLRRCSRRAVLYGR